MKRFNKALFTSLCCAAAFSLSAMSNAHADTAGTAPSPVLVYGTAVKEGEDRLHLTNSNPQVAQNDIIVTTSGETTRILDATTGLPVAFEDIREGETIYAYIGPAMTLSLPPMSNATLVLCRIPADYKVPEYVEVSSLQKGTDQTATLTGTNGQTYAVNTETQILPYLTRNIVTLDDLTKGKTCLIWSLGGSDKATKIMVFPEESIPAGESQKTGWKQENGSWLYYNEEGNAHSGWLFESGDWYYLNPETHVMHTGFLTLDGKTYYLQDNGKMLKTTKAFTPDKDGVLK